MIQLNIIEPIKRAVYDPDRNLIGFLNIFEFNDIRLQIAKERTTGYYASFEGRIIQIRPDGSCDSWPNGFFDQYETQLRELINYKFMNTSEKWQELYPNPKVIDPDGWDRENYQWSWYNQSITYTEYQRRLSLSTCMSYKIPE